MHNMANVEKILVEHFNILNHHNQMAIELPFKEEPLKSASFLYDGRNCAILIRNNSKAFILTNIAYDLRSKLLNAKPLFIVEAFNQEIYNAYPVEVINTPIPFADRLHKVVDEILGKIVKKYGPQSLDLMVKKLWPEDDQPKGEK